MAVHSGSLDFKTPLIFADGTQFFAELEKKYKRHAKGFFIMAPSGAGKTHFVKHQEEQDWMDGDALWENAHAHPSGPWWLESFEVMDEIDARSDFITKEAKKLGFWIVGASNNWLKPDAIVLPHWSTHKRYIKTREETNYDGGATSDRLGQVLGHRKWIRKWRKKGVPQFNSVAQAAEYLKSTL